VLRKLIEKDLILGQRILALTGGIFTLYFAAALTLRSITAGGYAALTGIMCAFLAVTLIARDDKLKANSLTCSLPVTRRSVVLARYVEGITLGLLGIVVAVVVGLITPWSVLDPRELLTGRTVMVGVTVVTITIALVLPFLLRFGIWGLFGLLIGAQLLGVFVTLLGMALERTNPLRHGIYAVVQTVETSVASFYASLSTLGFAAMSMGLLVALLALSYGVALVAFAHRDL
jgi:ABC-type transport system involved in multi-copper enzyme maturation permease subunit